MNKHKVADNYKILQLQICDKLEALDGQAVFNTDEWSKPLGYGITKTITQGGDAIEKAAVNYSVVNGKLSLAMQQALNLEEEDTYFASGISSIIHPKNPHVPIIHMNVRYFALGSGKAWFGGGIDLTPHYVNKGDAKEFHQALKKLCDKYDAEYYQAFKQEADDYFYLPHREETRGVGGIFFDHREVTNHEKFTHFLDFTTDLAKAYPVIYAALLNKNRNTPFKSIEKQWQNLRRGRYVEFNLLYDRGTKFGLESNGRTESILLSLPPDASWVYNFEPKEHSAEAKTLALLKKGVNWLELDLKPEIG